MKKLLFFVLCTAYSLVGAFASTPDKVIPFIFNGHLYIQGILADSTRVSLIYDTGADCLYLDKDYMQQSAFGKRPFRKIKARMAGAGNGGSQTIDMIVDAVPLQMGAVEYKKGMTPIINLRDIVGCHADGMIGNDAFWEKPLMVNFTEECLVQIDELTPALLEGYTKLPAHLNGNRFEVECELAVSASQVLKGRFLLDMGSGSTVSLTNATRKRLNLDGKKQAVCHYSNFGIGGDGREVIFRADSFKFLDSLDSVIVSASYNTAGALAEASYLGVIGNEILRHYDIIIDAPGKALYAKRNGASDATYRASTKMQMGYIDRTDICDGWIVSMLYENGIAQAAGFKIDDVILEINGRPVKSISWEEQRHGLNLQGDTTFKVQKKDGAIVTYTLFVGESLI